MKRLCPWKLHMLVSIVKMLLTWNKNAEYFIPRCLEIKLKICFRSWSNPWRGRLIQEYKNWWCVMRNYNTEHLQTLNQRPWESLRVLSGESSLDREVWILCLNRFFKIYLDCSSAQCLESIDIFHTCKIKLISRC